MIIIFFNSTRVGCEIVWYTGKLKRSDERDVIEKAV